jgi:hypothetical protein
MTTVAYRAGTMACDSCWTAGDGGIDSLASKIRRLKSGALLGAAGDNDSRPLERLLDRVATPARMPPFETLIAIRREFCGLLVLPCGAVFKVATALLPPENWNADFSDDIGVWPIHAPFAAVGSGAAYALGAMAAGADPRDAVSIACGFDPHSRPPVHFEVLHHGKTNR